MHRHKYPMHIILKSWKAVTVILGVYSLMEKKYREYKLHENVLKSLLGLK